MKNKKEFFEQAQVMDRKQAEKIVSKHDKKVRFARVGFIIAIISTIMAVISFMTDLPELSWYLGVASSIGALASYIIGGGFLIALKYAFKIGICGWIIVPFPIDIFTGMMTFMFSIVAFFFLPVIFVGLSYIQIKKDYEVACLYVANNS